MNKASLWSIQAVIFFSVVGGLAYSFYQGAGTILNIVGNAHNVTVQIEETETAYVVTQDTKIHAFNKLEVLGGLFRPEGQKLRGLRVFVDGESYKKDRVELVTYPTALVLKLRTPLPRGERDVRIRYKIKKRDKQPGWYSLDYQSINIRVAEARLSLKNISTERVKLDRRGFSGGAYTQQAITVSEQTVVRDFERHDWLAMKILPPGRKFKNRLSPLTLPGDFLSFEALE